MTLEEFKKLKDGDIVTYNGDVKRRRVYEPLIGGETLTRKSNWMDDDHSVMFTYGPNGHDFHFFSIEDIKE